jgi:hypothetical protein
MVVYVFYPTKNNYLISQITFDFYTEFHSLLYFKL